jgi:hypothetical protein
VVYCSNFENCRVRKGTEGSNPSFSAIQRECIMQLRHIPVPTIKVRRLVRPLSAEDLSNESVRQDILDRVTACRNGTPLPYREALQLLRAVECTCPLTEHLPWGGVIRVGKEVLYVYPVDDLIDTLPGDDEPQNRHTTQLIHIALMQQWPIWSKKFTLEPTNGR